MNNEDKKEKFLQLIKDVIEELQLVEIENVDAYVRDIENYIEDKEDEEPQKWN